MSQNDYMEYFRKAETPGDSLFSGNYILAITRTIILLQTLNREWMEVVSKPSVTLEQVRELEKHIDKTKAVLYTLEQHKEHLTEVHTELKKDLKPDLRFFESVHSAFMFKNSKGN